ncbi:ATP-binding cassette domain-containing protein [Streptomyces sp. NPDC058644]|uniref:ATP-binding cassette domain-containing protein n=1 Tax=unclassified Streptomyces TaxID=2593676 RepID=UPI00366726DA
MPAQITALAVSKSFNGRPVLDSVTCSLARGERTGIVGENGSGKTTLLRLLARRERPDQGEVIVQADGGVGYLAQAGGLPAQVTAGQVIDGVLGDLRGIEARPWFGSRDPPVGFWVRAAGGAGEYVDQLLALGVFGRARLGVAVARLSTGWWWRWLVLVRLVSRVADVLLFDGPAKRFSPVLAEGLGGGWWLLPALSWL